MVEPAALLRYAEELLASAKTELDYRTVIERAYYSAYHIAVVFEDGLPHRSTIQTSTGSHDALIQRLERPSPNLDDRLRNISKYVGAELRAFKALRELASYRLEEVIRVDQAEQANLAARDIAEECTLGNRIIKKMAPKNS